MPSGVTPRWRPSQSGFATLHVSSVVLASFGQENHTHSSFLPVASVGSLSVTRSDSLLSMQKQGTALSFCTISPTVSAAFGGSEDDDAPPADGVLPEALAPSACCCCCCSFAILFSAMAAASSLSSSSLDAEEVPEELLPRPPFPMLRLFLGRPVHDREAGLRRRTR